MSVKKPINKINPNGVLVGLLIIQPHSKPVTKSGYVKLRGANEIGVRGKTINIRLIKRSAKEMRKLFILFRS